VNKEKYIVEAYWSQRAQSLRPHYRNDYVTRSQLSSHILQAFSLLLFTSNVHLLILSVVRCTSVVDGTSQNGDKIYALTLEQAIYFTAENPLWVSSLDLLSMVFILTRRSLMHHSTHRGDMLPTRPESDTSPRKAYHSCLSVQLTPSTDSLQ